MPKHYATPRQRRKAQIQAKKEEKQARIARGTSGVNQSPRVNQARRTRDANELRGQGPQKHVGPASPTLPPIGNLHLASGVSSNPVIISGSQGATFSDVRHPPPPQPRSSEPEPQPQLAAANAVRVSVVAETFLLGDYERFIWELMWNLDDKIAWNKVICLEPNMVYPHPSITQVGAQVTGSEGLVDAIQNSDIILAWGGRAPSIIREVGASLEGHKAKVMTLGTPAPCLSRQPKYDSTRAAVREDLGIPADARVVFHSAELRNETNPYALVQAIRALNDSLEDGEPRYFGVFVGEGHQIVELQQYAGTLAPKDTKLLGGRPDPTYYLLAADVLMSAGVAPYGGQDIIDAWAMGVPVVATPASTVMGPNDDSSGEIEPEPVKSQAALLIPRAVEGSDEIPHERLQQQELAERISGDYAEAIRSVFADAEATDKRVEYAKRVLESDWSPEPFAHGWLEQIKAAAEA